MSLSINAKQWVLKTQTEPGHPFNMDLSSPEASFELKEVTLKEDSLQDGDILIETIYLSNDPAQKFWIISADKNYAAGVAPGEPIPARGLGKVLASKNTNFPVGALISAQTNWSTHTIIRKEQLGVARVLPMEGVEQLWWYLSVLGGTAVTAYFIFYRYADLQDCNPESHGKTFLISGAAGAVGSMCVQIAANVFKAKKIIAIAGGPQKVKFVESLAPSVVVGVDYKDPKFNENLLEAAGGENTVDYFIDNVGGKILDLGCNLMKPLSTIVACGSISGYNDPSQLVFKNYVSVITKRLTLRGLLLMDNYDKFPEAYSHLTQWIKDGKIDKTTSATIVDATNDKFVNVPTIWDGLFHGKNTGKLITKVNEE
ncbi:similar to Saccharomyces cerevisiae YML131W Putative protein of unknown function with similarity to medium chain dehydrogenase/reductases [Maudiozyma saulgeensis]|uniref:Enoyl reductase (ER) domain-containing protein n=1 Tax=Maudiozyma saulgeensis TaxID=1789683 RepID=A0A1X7R339_9SACH|nr:similar to Saccharomyces cerevisiae YML131W Putative protein of unknown function with similarity to medium chain dehydrogenase/reductases [Kazachstania saulgeensis]